MSRYDAMFTRLESEGEGALGLFLMLGHPDVETCARLLEAVGSAGADMVEVGIPFSDPVADGPVIQAAGRRALSAGVRVEDCFALICAFARACRRAAGHSHLRQHRRRARVRPVLRARGRGGRRQPAGGDVPTLEPSCSPQGRAAGLDWVMIAATNSPPASLEQIARLGSGYTYCVTRFEDPALASRTSLRGELFERLGDEHAAPPVLGFGISSGEHAASALGAGAKGVIVGSAVVALAEQPNAVQAVRDKVRALKDATFAVPAHSG